MKSALNVDDDVPASLENVRAALVAMFNYATRARGRVLVFIDALHSVDNESGASWLPNEAEIPIGVQFFLGIRRIDRHHDFVEESAHPVPFKMPALEYNLISSCSTPHGKASAHRARFIVPNGDEKLNHAGSFEVRR